MERVERLVQVSQEDAKRVSELTIPCLQVHVGPSFYKDFALRGIRVHRVDPRHVSYTFRVPPRLLAKLAIGLSYATMLPGQLKTTNCCLRVCDLCFLTSSLEKMSGPASALTLPLHLSPLQQRLS